MAMNPQGRPTAPGSASSSEIQTFTGNRGLDHEEALIFEIVDYDRSGVDVAPPPPVATRLGGLERHRPIGLPGLSAGRGRDLMGVSLSTRRR